MDQVFWIQLIFQPQNSYGPEDFWTKYFFGPKIFGPLIRLELHFFLDTTLFGTQSFGLNIYSYNFSNPTFLPTFFHGFKKNFRTGNQIIRTGNGICSPTSRPQIKKHLYKRVVISPTLRPLIKKLLLQNVSHLIQGFQN